VQDPGTPSPQPLSIEDYLAVAAQVGPFSELDDFAVSDVGCAVIVTSAQKARQRGAAGPLCEIAATAQSHNDQPMTWFEPRVLAAAGDGPVRHVADRLYAVSGMRPDDIDVAHLYDCTSFALLHNLEETRLCERGEAAKLLAEPDSLATHGIRPTNTNGGDLVGGYSHGFRHVIEAARQVTGRATNQVTGAETALVMGAQVGPTSGAILRRWDS
jgi:acetyl-CoA acetyltransferase